MYNKTIIIIFLFFLMFFSSKIYPENIIVKAEHLSGKDGLSQGYIKAILQDSKGFMWFGTKDGLNKYDGYKFTVFRNNPNDPFSISYNHINTLYEDNNKKIWIGTNGGGLNIYDMRIGQFKNFKHNSDNPNSISNNIVTSIAKDKHGFIWIGTKNGLNKYNHLTKKFTHFMHDPKNKQSLNDNNIMHVYIDKSDRLWIGTAKGGLNLFERKSGKFKHFFVDPFEPKNLTNNMVLSINEDNDGNLWIGTYGKGIIRFTPLLGDYISYKQNIKDSRSLTNNYVRSLIINNKNILWSGSDNSIIDKFNKEKKFFTHYLVKSEVQSSIYTGTHSLYYDNSETLWIGTTGHGIKYFLENSSKFKTIRQIQDDNNSLGFLSIRSVYEDDNKVLWIGGYNGLNRIDQKTGKYKYFLKKYPVSSICKDPDNQKILWIGTEGKYFFKFNKKTEKIIPINWDYIKYFKHHTMIYKILFDNDGILWIGTNRGLQKINRTNKTSVFYKHDPQNPNSIAEGAIKTIFEENNELLWIGSGRSGISILNRKNNQFTNYKHNQADSKSLSNNVINSFYEDSSGNFWIGTGNGLNIFDKYKKTFKSYTSINGLPNNVIYGILEDKKENLWISTNKGLSKFNQKSKAFNNYDVDDGLQENEFNRGAYFKNKNGEMFFGGINGLNTFLPSSIKNNPYKPPIVLTSFKKYNKEIKLVNHISEIKELKLSFKDIMISFEFAALNYYKSKKNLYKYTLEGFNKDWIELGTKRDITFTNLDPGKYTLKIKGSNNDGVWNETPLILKIIITPPIWKTLWFTILSIILFAIISYLIINLFKKYLTLITYWKKKNYISHYKIIDQIAIGGMGIVYKAIDLLDNTKTVAIKVIKDEYYKVPVQRKRFINEATIIDQINHKNIVNIIERGESNSQLFLVMEFLKGPTLSQKITENKRISLRDFINISIQLVEVINIIHSKGIIHRDLKPDNIMLTENNAIDEVKLLDFGLAKSQNLTKLTEMGMIVGTFSYISPEQISGSISKQSDIYSLGIIFYEMVTGEKPFKGDTPSDIINKVIKNIPIEPSKLCTNLPIELNELIIKMTNKKPELRPDYKEIIKILRKTQSMSDD